MKIYAVINRGITQEAHKATLPAIQHAKTMPAANPMAPPHIYEGSLRTIPFAISANGIIIKAKTNMALHASTPQNSVSTRHTNVNPIAL